MSNPSREIFNLQVINLSFLPAHLILMLCPKWNVFLSIHSAVGWIWGSWGTLIDLTQMHALVGRIHDGGNSSGC